VSYKSITSSLTSIFVGTTIVLWVPVVVSVIWLAEVVGVSVVLVVVVGDAVVAGFPKMLQGQWALTKQRKKKHFLTWQVP